MKKFYGKGLPNVDPDQLTGTLIVVEGADGSGRTTQINPLRAWLERCGFPTIDVGIKRSALAGEELDAAMEGNTLSPITFSLFYATDFADQLEHRILPALRAGFVVLSDRYIYTLMARDIVRGANPEWVREVYSNALVPDAIFHLNVPPNVLAERNLQKNGVLDFWESGMDIQRSGDMYECFIRYQRTMARQFEKLGKEYGFIVVDGNRDPGAINEELQHQIGKMLKITERPVRKTKRARPRRKPSDDTDDGSALKIVG